MDFYNSQNALKPRPINGMPGQPLPTQPRPIQGRGITPGQNMNTGQVGYLSSSQLSDPQWGFGPSFQAAAKQGSVEALQRAQSSANPEDYAAMDESRDWFRNRLADLPTMEKRGMSTFDTQSQRGLQNLLAQHRSANAGTGNLGSRQYAGAQGNITSRAITDYMQGLQNVQRGSLQDAIAINSGLGNIQGRDLQERGFQNQQAQALSDLLMQQAGIDLQREGMLPQKQESNWVADIMPAVGMGAGAIIGGPAGAAIGGQLGSSVGGAMGSKNAAASGAGSSQLSLLLANQKALNNGGYSPSQNYAQNWANPVEAQSPLPPIPYDYGQQNYYNNLYGAY